MYCINCGNEIPEGQNVCPSCNSQIEKKEEAPSVATPVAPATQTAQTVPAYTYTPRGVSNMKANANNLDKSTKGIALLGFFLFPIGIIFYFLSKKDTPVRAKTALQGSIFGIVTFSVAAVVFIFLVLPVVKRYSLKYMCVTNYPGSYYTYQTYTCHKPDGSELTIMPKEGY